MVHTIEGLARDIRDALTADTTDARYETVREIVSKALLDKDFVAEHATEETCKPRKVLYEDPDLGFCICAHVYADKIDSPPHDHGPTWAIYGLAEGTTAMTDWKIVKPGEGDQPALVEAVRTYDLNPGDAHYYAPGDVHSPVSTGAVKLLRIEGGNLDRVKRSNIAKA